MFYYIRRAMLEDEGLGEFLID